MTKDRFFISIESTTEETTNKLLPGGKLYGFEHVVGLSKHYNNDIACINGALKMVAALSDVPMDARYNAKFFPHLGEEYSFSTSTETNETTSFLEESFIVYRANLFDEDKEDVGQIAVCKRPDMNSVMNEEAMTDHHFDKENVSFKTLLN